MDERNVKGGGETDRLGKHGGHSRSRYAMQRFAPPIIGGHLQTGDFARLVYQLRYLLLQGHLCQQVVDAEVDRLRGIEINSGLRQATGACQHQGEQDKQNSFGY
jgi:hypothetical protein